MPTLTTPSGPFCEGEVDAALPRDGGPCPHGLNVIPGEDAATDPGAGLVPAHWRSR